jgi:hypothetical protein
MRTLHQSKCHESQQKAKRAVKNTANKTIQKQKSTLKKLRKKTWGF